MAEKRMFAKSIIDTDAFLSMPLSAQALYFHLCMRADDDGFVSNPRKIQRMISCADDDLKLLIAKRYILAFDSGVIVIKHWRIHNYIRKDTYKETLYLEEKSTLFQKPDGAYTDHQLLGPSRTRDEPVTDPSTQYRLDKIRLDKDSIEENIAPDEPAYTPSEPITPEEYHAELKKEEKKKFHPPTVGEVTDYCRERNNHVDPDRFVDFYASKGWMVGKTKMKDWKASVRTWERGDSNARAYQQHSERRDNEPRTGGSTPKVPKYGTVL